MRFWLLGGLLAALLFIPFASAQSVADRTATISGVVKGVGDSPTVVYLESTDDNPTRYYDGYQVAGEKNGSFSFSEIKPGTYQLRAEAFGFMSADPSGHETEITLRPNEKRKGVAIAMVRRRAICGRVTENGRPRLRTMWVNAFRYDPEFGALSMTFLPSTDADGTFRFADLDPGTYYLQGYTTWYPGSFNFNDAKPVILGPDPAPTKCLLDIPLQYTGCHGTKVSGQIAPTSANDSTQYRVNFLERNHNGGSVATAIAMNFKNSYKAGESFSGTVCPGDYEVVLTDQYGTGWGSHPRGELYPHKVIFDSQTVKVSQTEIDGLLLTPRAMASISGAVHFEDITRYASCPGLGGQHIDILREGDGEFQSAKLDDKDRFEIHDVAPGDYTIYLGPFLREAVYVKSIVVNGKAVESRRFSIAQPAPATIEITLSGDLAHASGHISPDLRREKRWEVAWTRPKGSVSGKVQGDVEGGYTVKLLSARFNSNASGEYSTHTSTDGTFYFDSVDPSVYTLRAESGNSLKYEYGSRQAGQRGTPIIVTRGAHLKDLTLFPPKLGAICGRVTDATGAPRSGLRIFVETFENGQLVDKSRGNIYLGHESEATQTDSSGHFRADKLPPGEYLFAFPYGYFSAFFSSDGSLSAATTLQLPVGKDLGCGAESPIELRVPAVVNQGHTIAGQVVGDLPKSVGDRFWVSITWDLRGSGGHPWAGTAKLDDTHKFHVDHVPNGRFLLELYSAYGPEPMTWSGPYGPVSHLLATQSFEVRDQDVLDMQIAPMRLPSVSGTVHFEHLPAEWKGFDASSQFITLVPSTYRAPFSAKLSADGGFNIDPEDPGDYEVTFNQLRDPLYVRSILIDGHEVRGRYLRLSDAQSAHLEVFVSGNAGRVNASVSPDPSVPLPEPSVSETCGSRLWPEYQLFLFPDPLLFSESGSSQPIEPRVIRGYKVGYDDHPSLQAGAVPPGRYRAVTAEHLWPSPFLVRPDGLVTNEERQWWSAIAALGQPVTVQAGAKLEIVLPDRTIDVARLAAKFGMSLDASGSIEP